MKIERIVTYPVAVPLKPEYYMISALGTHEVSQYLIVRIETDADLEGAGEATVLPQWSGETVRTAKTLIDDLLSPLLIGKDPRNISEIVELMDLALQDNWFTKSAIEMACWDITGKEVGAPVYGIIGGPVRDLTFRCRFSLGAYPPEKANQRAKQLVDAGFTTIKVKVGLDPKEDELRLRAVRDAIGFENDLVIDANCGWDAETAIQFCKSCEDLQIALFEQPTPRHDYSSLAEVRCMIDPEVMADEIVFDLEQAQQCVDSTSCDVISVYPGKNGGISKTMAILEFAEDNGVSCSIGSNLELDIATAAMCHCVIASCNMNVEQYPGDVLGPVYHQERIVKNPISIEGPMVTAPAGPGLGIDVDWKLIETLAMKL